MTGHQLLNQLVAMREVLDELITAAKAAPNIHMATHIPRDLEHDWKCLNEAFQDFQMRKEDIT